MDPLEKAAAELGEIYDSVLIVVTTHEEGVSNIAATGAGNVYARIGSAREWLRQVERQTGVETSEWFSVDAPLSPCSTFLLGWPRDRREGYSVQSRYEAEP